MEKLCESVSFPNVVCTFVSADRDAVGNELWNADSCDVEGEGVFLQIVCEKVLGSDFKLYVGVGSIDAFLDMDYDVSVIPSTDDSSRRVCGFCRGKFLHNEEMYWLDFGKGVHSVCWESLEETVEEYCSEHSELIVADQI